MNIFDFSTISIIFFSRLVACNAKGLTLIFTYFQYNNSYNKEINGIAYRSTSVLSSAAPRLVTRDLETNVIVNLINTCYIDSR